MGQTLSITPNPTHVTCIKYFRSHDTGLMAMSQSVNPVMSTCLHIDGFTDACYYLNDLFGRKINTMFIAGPIYSQGDSQIVVTGKPKIHANSKFSDNNMRIPIGASVLE